MDRWIGGIVVLQMIDDGDVWIGGLQTEGWIDR